MLALAVPVQRRLGGTQRSRLAVVLAMLGAALFYGDGVITPAISVLSAVEGLEITAPALDHVVVPIAVGVLTCPFSSAPRNGRRRALLRPDHVPVVFSTGHAGNRGNSAPSQCASRHHPAYAAGLFLEHRFLAFAALGSVVLAVTGAEALYADMGHFGRRPMRLAWASLILPVLLLNYFGQGPFSSIVQKQSPIRSTIWHRPGHSTHW